LKHALMTLNIGGILCENSRASFMHAADRWGCDYVEVTEAKPGVHPWAMKLLAFEIMPNCDRVCYIDADMVIAEDCPNPFESFPAGAFIAVSNQQPQMTESCLNACDDTIAQDVRKISDRYGWMAGEYVTNFINSGFWLASRTHHEAVLAMALEISLAMNGVTAWHDQSALNYALAKAQTPVLQAHETWNYQFPPDTGAGEMTEFIYHWAGGENRDRMPDVNWRARRKRLLWIGDACVHTGFARVTHSVLEQLRRQWDVTCIGVNYRGQPHSYPYPIWPAGNYGDVWGLRAFGELLDEINPDLVCVLNDPWIVSRFANEIDRRGIPMAAYMPVDARNQRATGLNALDMAIFYTKFGEKECRLGGFKGPSAIIGHGVDLDLYRPVDKVGARARLDVDRLPPGCFIIGNVNRNSPRKRLDLTIQYFAEWLRQRAGAADKIEDAYLYLHCSQKDSGGLDLAQLASFYGVDKRVILPAEELVTPAKGLPEEDMPYVYGCFDVQVSTTAGEGWGLSQIEGAACGIPQIVPQFAALSEWMAGAAWMVPCSGVQTHPVVNTVGEVPDKAAFIKALDLFYRRPELRAKYAALALACAQRPEYRWAKVAEMFHWNLGQMYVNARARAAQRETEERKSHGKVQEPKSVPAAAC